MRTQYFTISVRLRISFLNVILIYLSQKLLLTNVNEIHATDISFTIPFVCNAKICTQRYMNKICAELNFLADYYVADPNNVLAVLRWWSLHFL